MPYEIEEHPNYLLLRLLPVLTKADLDRASADLAKLEAKFPAPRNRITDLTSLETIDVGFPDIEMVAKRRREVKLPKQIRSVLVASRPIQFGFARMFQTLNDNPNIDLRIMKTLDEAVRWFESE